MSAYVKGRHFAAQSACPLCARKRIIGLGEWNVRYWQSGLTTTLAEPRKCRLTVETCQLLVPYIRTDRTYVSTKLRIIIHNFTH
jgi:hypothetical protein